MSAVKTKGRFAFDLLLSLEDNAISKTSMSDYYMFIKDVLCDFMGVENFYVALLKNDLLSYPLAVRNQKIVNWEKRPLSNRLTDKVILDGESIFLTKDAEDFVVHSGFKDSSDESLSAWMGVPLIVEDKAIGCLSVFSTEPDFYFDEIDEILFSLVAAKLSSRLEITQLTLSNATYLERLYSRQQIDMVLNSVSGGVVFVELSGDVVLTNESFRTLVDLKEDGIFYQELPREAFEMLACDVDEIGAWLEKATSDEDVKDHHTSYQVGDRFYHRELTSVYQEGEIVGLLFVVTDVTDEVSLRETRSLISSTIVHDLRSPMSSVVSALMLINEVLPEGFSNPIYDQAFEIAQRNVQRVINLVESLLDISKLESGEMKLFKESFDLNDVIDEMVLEQKSRADYMGVSVLVENLAEVSVLNADRNMIQRVIQNLLDNALKYSSGSDEVLVRLMSENDAFLIVKVIDQGPGIPEEQRDRVFERFSQIPGEKKSGAGLGLTFCRLAVEAHDGEVFVEENPSGGSVFVVKLPLKEE